MKTSNIQTTHNQAIIKGWVDPVALTAGDGGNGNVGQYQNAAGTDFAVGDVVALAADGTVVLADVANDPRPTGVTLDGIANGSFGPVVWSGPVPLINVTASVTAGDFAETTTTPGQAAGFASPSATSFGYFTSSGTTPSGFLARGGGIGSIIATDGSVTVSPATELDFDPADFTVTDLGGGVAQIALVGGGGSGLLGYASVQAGSDGLTYAAPVTTMGDVDATNLAVTFAAPGSGDVLVRLTGRANNGAGNQFWGVRNGSTTLATGIAASGAVFIGVSIVFPITGLTPGASYTFKWGFYYTVLACYISTGPTYGPAVMEVSAA